NTYPDPTPAMDPHGPLPPFCLERRHLGDLLHRGRHNAHGGPFPMRGGPPQERRRKADLHVDHCIRPGLAGFLGELLEGPVRPAPPPLRFLRPPAGRPPAAPPPGGGPPPRPPGCPGPAAPAGGGGGGACTARPPHPTTLSSRPRLVRVPRRRDTAHLPSPFCR